MLFLKERNQALYFHERKWWWSPSSRNEKQSFSFLKGKNVEIHFIIYNRKRAVYFSFLREEVLFTEGRNQFLSFSYSQNEHPLSSRNGIIFFSIAPIKESSSFRSEIKRSILFYYLELFFPLLFQWVACPSQNGTSYFPSFKKRN